jgi:hypothetical protein
MVGFKTRSDAEMEMRHDSGFHFYSASDDFFSSTRIVGFERETISTTIDLIVAVCDGHPMLNVLDSRQIQDWRG